MCGIAGIIRRDEQPVERARLERMLAHLRHRGPDGEGILDLPGGCSLVHTRLSIIDLPHGAQPMAATGDRMTAGGQRTHEGMTVVFNGEIYNHHDLRQKLEKRGYEFQSDHSDTEVLIHGYHAWGSDLCIRLQGMYAFAIWDEVERSLFLARDRTGKKPLYYRQRDGELQFASLVATMVAGAAEDASIEIDREALLCYLRFGYTFNQSMIKDVRELPAAHWMKVARDDSVETQRYWSPPNVSKTDTARGLLEGMRMLISDAVERRLEADVPLGSFLSGGIDSSLIVAVAQQYLKKRGEPPLRTFSVSMPDVDYDESEYAIAVAEHVGSDHTVLSAKPEDTVDNLKNLIAVTGEPTADSSILPTFILCKATREYVKAALSGEGGDELFGGYDRYRAMRLLAAHRWWMRYMPRGMTKSSDLRSFSSKVRRLLHAAHGEGPAGQYRRMVELFSEDALAALGINPVEKVSIPNWPDIPDRGKAAMRWDFHHYLPFDLLRKMDRASMACALEVRCPMLDTHVVELANHLPTEVLMPGGRPKHILRQLAAEVLPASIARRPKRGFAIPIGRWFHGPLAPIVRHHLLEGRLEQLGLQRRPLEVLVAEHAEEKADHTHRIFALLQLSLWYDWFDAARRGENVLPPTLATPD